MAFTIFVILVKLLIGLILLPLAGYGIYRGIQAYDKKDTDWNKSDINGDPLSTSIYAGSIFIGLCILSGLTLAGLFIGVFL